MNLVIGVDFDNTLVNYDELMHAVARQRGLIQPDVRKSKQAIRDAIRQLPDGEIEWQRLQAIAYGPRMGEARLIAGVPTFFELCKEHRIPVFIISHKTEYVVLDETETNLRVAAMAWMRENGFFDVARLGLSPNDVYFESTRREKTERIRHLGCTHFIDDLAETFLEDSFPANVEKILYAPRMPHSSLPGARALATWQEISDYFSAQLRSVPRG